MTSPNLSHSTALGFFAGLVYGCTPLANLVDQDLGHHVLSASLIALSVGFCHAAGSWLWSRLTKREGSKKDASRSRQE